MSLLTRALRYACPANSDLGILLGSHQIEPTVHLPFEAGPASGEDWATRLADDDTVLYGEVGR